MITIAKKWFCDYRECDKEEFREKIGKRGESVFMYGDLPERSDWIKTDFTGRGQNQHFHFCSQDCMEKELNLLTQQGLESPEKQRSLEASTS